MADVVRRHFSLDCLDVASSHWTRPNERSKRCRDGLFCWHTTTSLFSRAWIPILAPSWLECNVISENCNAKWTKRIKKWTTISNRWNPTWLSMGISNPRSRLSMPIGSSYRLFGVTFSDGSRARRWALSTGPLAATSKITEFYFEGSRLKERKKGWRGVDYGDEPSTPIGDICRTG